MSILPFRIYTVKLINFVCFTFRTSPLRIFFFHSTPKIINIGVKRARWYGSMPHHSPIMNFSWPTPKPFKTKSSLLSQFYFIKLHIHTTIFFIKIKVFPNVTNIHLYTNLKKIKQENFLKFIYHMALMWFHMHNKMQRLFT